MGKPAQNLDEQPDDESEEVQQEIAELEAAAEVEAELGDAYAGLSDAEHRIAAIQGKRGLKKEAREWDAKAVQSIRQAADHENRAADDWEREQELEDQIKTEHLAVEVRRTSQTELTTLITGVSELAGAVHQKVTARELAEVEGGDQIKGKQLRERVTFLGAAIKHSLARGADLTHQQAVELVQQLVQFVADILTIADHVKWLFDLFMRFRPAFEPFIFR